MARIRTIKPEFCHSESMGRISRDARLTFILLWTLSDDEGRLRGNSKMLASLLYPYDEDAGGLIDSWLVELETERCITRYSVDGSSYIEICNWTSHQKIDKPSRSKLPASRESSRILANPRERSSEDLDLDLDLEGTKKTILEKVEFDPKTVPGLNIEAWNLWLTHRKAIKKPILSHSMPFAAKKLAKLNGEQMASVELSVANGYQGLKGIDWDKQEQRQVEAPRARPFGK